MSPYLYVRISVYVRCIFGLSIEILRGLNCTFIVDLHDFPGFCETFWFLINHSTLLYVAQRDLRVAFGNFVVIPPALFRISDIPRYRRISEGSRIS